MSNKPIIEQLREYSKTYNKIDGLIDGAEDISFNHELGHLQKALEHGGELTYLWTKNYLFYTIEGNLCCIEDHQIKNPGAAAQVMFRFQNIEKLNKSKWNEILENGYENGKNSLYYKGFDKLKAIIKKNTAKIGAFINKNKYNDYALKKRLCKNEITINDLAEAFDNVHKYIYCTSDELNSNGVLLLNKKTVNEVKETIEKQLNN